VALQYQGWAYVSCSAGPPGSSGSANAQGPTGSLQFHSGSSVPGGSGISGSANLLYLTASSELHLTGNLLVSGNVLVSGTITALNYDVVNHTITYLSSSGASKFGDSTDDLHQFTGSVKISGAANSTLFRVDGGATSPVIFATGSGRVAIGHDSPAYALSVNGYVEFGNGSGLGYLVSRGDSDTHLRFSAPGLGSDSMALVAGGKQFITIDNNATSSNDYIILGTTSTDNTYVSGNLFVCDGTASISNLSGCSPIQVLSPIQMQSGLSLSFNGATNTAKITNNGSNLNINSPGSIVLSSGNSNVSSSANVSASAFYANGVELTVGGGGTPGGSDTQVQFNDGGSFGGDSGLVYNKTTDTLTAVTITASAGINPQGPGSMSIQIGAPAGPTSTRSIVIGDNAAALASADIAIGANTRASKGSGIIVGQDSVITGSSAASAAIIIGYNSTVSSSAVASNAIVIGSRAQARAVNAIALGSGSINTTANSMTIGSPSQGMDFNVTGNITLLNNGDNSYGHLNVCQGTASIAHLSGCSPIQVHAPMQIQSLDEGGILIAGASGELSTDVDSLQWTTDRGDNGGYLGLVVSSSASGSAALGDGIIMMTDAADEDICFITADGAEFAVDVNVDADLSGSGAVQGTTANFGGLNFEGNKVLTSNDGTIMFGATADQDLRANSLFLSSALGIGVPAGAPPLSLNVHYTGSGNPSNLSNDTGGGEVVYFGTSSAVLPAGGLYYLNSAGEWESADSANTGSGHNQLLGIAMGQADGTPGTPAVDGMLIKGFFHEDSYFSGSFIKGGPLYIQSSSAGRSATEGGYVSGAAPTAADSYVRVVGYGTDTANVIYFNPDSTYIEIG